VISMINEVVVNKRYNHVAVRQDLIISVVTEDKDFVVRMPLDEFEENPLMNWENIFLKINQKLSDWY